MSFNLAFFNGDVRRDKKQEAMLKSMNERDNFLNRLQEMEKKRELDERQEKASRKIQKKWKSYRTRHASHQELRTVFDQLIEQNKERNEPVVLRMSQLVANFYESHQDEERLVMTLVEVIKLKLPIPDSRRFLLGRCCVKFLKQGNENTIFFHIFRFLEEYIFDSPSLLEAISEVGLFDAELHLFETLVGPRDGNIGKAVVTPRHDQLLSRIFQLFVNKQNKTEVTMKTADRMLKSLCVTIPDDLFTNYILYYIKDHIKTNSRNYTVFLESLKCADFGKWNIPPQLRGVATARIRSIFLTQIEQINRNEELFIQLYFDSLATFLKTYPFENVTTEEDLSQTGRTRTKAVQFLENYCQDLLHSDTFQRSACTYATSSNINVHTVIALREYFMHILDTLAASNSFIEALYIFVSVNSPHGEFDISNGKSPVSSALMLFCHCLNRRISSVADSDFVPTDVFQDFDKSMEFLRDVSIKIVHVMYPILARGEGNQRDRYIRTELEWKEVSEAVFSILEAVYQKDTRMKYFPEGFWTNHGRQVLIGLGEQTIRMPRRRFNSGRMQIERTVDTEFVERLAAIYESDDADSSDEESADHDRDLPVPLRRAICVMKQIPFIVPFMDRVQLFNRLLRREKDKYYQFDLRGVDENGQLTVRREHVFVDAYDQFGPRFQNDRVRELKAPVRVKMINWVGMRESGVDGGGIFREFLSELLKTAFDVERGYFTCTENRLLYPNPSAYFLLGADCLPTFQFIGRMIGKLIYERQLQEVRFAEFFIAQLFESDKNKDVDLQHMKSFDPLIFKNLKNLLKMSENELEDLQLDFSVVIDDMGLIRNVNLKPNGSKFRVNVDNVHEYVRLYVNHHLKLRIAQMVESIRKGISEVVNVDWMKMFAPHELQIMVAGNEHAYTANEMRSYCEVRFPRGQDDEYVEMLWDVVDKLSPDDKKALLKFITGCSRPPVDGFRSINPPLGILVSPSSDDSLPTSATCMNMLTIPRYSTRGKLEEKLRYAINSGSGFELA